MEVVRKDSGFYHLSKYRTLMIENDRQIDFILESPDRSLVVEDDRGYSLEKKTFRSNTRGTVGDSLRGRIEAARDANAELLQVSYDFFFGGTKRTLFPESEKTVRAYKVIHDLAREYGLGFSASVSNPLDLGDGYVKSHRDAGLSWHYHEGAIDDEGNYSVKLSMQTQWSNNKGPVRLELDRVVVYAFHEERFDNTSYFYVDPGQILDISSTAKLEIMGSEDISKRGNGSVPVRVLGCWAERGNGYDRCLAVLVYKTRELDYFADDVPDYMKGIIDLHAKAGITYQGFYSDEMHIQFDWDSNVHFDRTEINTRYVTPNMARRFAKLYGKEFEDFGKYLVYFSYHQHDFSGDERDLPAQHILKPGAEGVYLTWLFRKRYFELLNDVVVGLCVDVKKYTEQKFKNPVDAHGHATWKESPTLDKNYPEMKWYSLRRDDLYSRYDYHPEYVASSSVIEAVAGCYDYFRWNDYFSGGGTDHGEHGYADRNYYTQAFGASLAVLNADGRGYAGGWGSPPAVITRMNTAARVFGNGSFGGSGKDQFVQDWETRLTDVLAVYPLDLFYSEERFGSWMVQYGYCNYITEKKLMENAEIGSDGSINIKGRSYRALVFLYQSFVSKKTISLVEQILNKGGRVLWTSTPPVRYWDQDKCSAHAELAGDWCKLFGVKSGGEAAKPIRAKGRSIRFASGISAADMPIPTDMLPDYVYRFSAEEGGSEIAWLGNTPAGFEKVYPSGGRAVYLAFRARDDQSQSMGADISTLFDVLCYLGAYSKDGAEIKSRPKDARYLIQRFSNGSVSMANHFRTFYERWSSLYGRDPAMDEEYLRGRELPSLDIDLRDEELFGHSIRYSGTETLTYRLDGAGKLIGFCGNGKKIGVDGRNYNFTGNEGWFCFAPLAEKHLAGGIKAAVVLYSEKAGSVTIPNNFGVTDLKAAACKHNMLAVERDVSVRADSESITIAFDEGMADRNALIYVR
jgi:hypothetical protein